MQAVPEKHNFSETEEQIVAFWKKIDAFKTSLKKNEGKPLYSFYDGPPFATGLPHYGHILAGTIKDTVTRYAHMTGHSVERRFGWDTHGLPIEFEIDKKLGIKTKDQVIQFGIANYNEECRGIVLRYAKEWEKTVNRLGRWIDFENDYKTMDPRFMESVWWVFKQIYEKKLVYRGFKVMPYSTACTTPLSNFEANLAYKDVQDPAVIVGFPLKEDPTVMMLAFTTTPWTLPSNLALCVHPTFEYVRVLDKKTKQKYILCTKRLEALYKNPDEYAIEQTYKGSDLVGKQYEPLFDYFVAKFPNGFRVVADTYVTDDAGTGIVHNAPAFGEDDFRVCTTNNVCPLTTLPCPVDDNGRFTDTVKDWAGQYVKDADASIIKKLQQNGRLIHRSTLTHSYPFCWRSDTPLIYRAVSSWFVKVTDIRDRLLENNEATYWVPDFVKEKRFANWLKDARDWAISRNRYWGTPLPIWQSADGEEVVVIGSVEELKKLSGRTDISDLHSHYIDSITIPSKQGKGVLKRIPEVFDCWFESGSMPYAQQHYPFENKAKFEQSFPADFIAEGLDQTRGWFYTLLVISTALFDKPPFKNLIVNGLVLAADGKKMSKRLKNYPDPIEVVDKYGADALRLYLINSPVVRAESLKFQEKGVSDVIKDVFLRWFNAYRFFVQNALRAQEEGRPFVYNAKVGQVTKNTMDRWALAATNSLIKFVREEMKAYRLYTVVPRLVKFIDHLANWYVRLNRDRLRGKEGVEAETHSLSTLFQVLFTLCKAMGPFTPFLTEFMYQNLKHALPKAEQEESIHYHPFPTEDTSLIDVPMENAVNAMQTIIELGRTARDRAKKPIKSPLRDITILHADSSYHKALVPLEAFIKSELNVKNVIYSTDLSQLELKVVLDWGVIGKRVRGDRPKVADAIAALTKDQIAAAEKAGEIEVHGYKIAAAEFKVTRSLKSSGASKDGVETVAEGDVIIVMSLTVDQQLIDEGIAREVQNKIQRLRKESKLQVADAVVAFYSIPPTTKPDTLVEDVILAHRQTIEFNSNTPILPLRYKHKSHVLIGKTETEVNEAAFQLQLCRLEFGFNHDELLKLGDAQQADDIEHYIMSRNYGLLQAELTKNNNLTFSLNGKKITLVLNQHIFTSPHTYAKTKGFTYK